MPSNDTLSGSPACSWPCFTWRQWSSLSGGASRERTLSQDSPTSRPSSRGSANDVGSAVQGVEEIVPGEPRGPSRCLRSEARGRLLNRGGADEGPRLSSDEARHRSILTDSAA